MSPKIRILARVLLLNSSDLGEPRNVTDAGRNGVCRRGILHRRPKKIPNTRITGIEIDMLNRTSRDTRNTSVEW